MKLNIIKIIAISVLFNISCDKGSAQKKQDISFKKDKKSISKTVRPNQINKRPKGSVLAPDFSLSDLDGNIVQLSDYKGKVVMLNFWGTWCGPCRKEIPDFIKLIDKYQDKGLEILGVTLTSGPPSRIKQFSDRMGINYTLLTDISGNESQMVTSMYGKATGRPISGIPTTFIIDRQGYIVKKYIGPRSENIFYNALKPYI